jgi:RNA polymerase sigma factor (sigma-70 family)
VLSPFVDRASELFAHHHAALYRYLVRLSGDADVAADAAQEAFVRLIERPPPRAAERAWLFKVGTNYVLAGRRTAARRERLLVGQAERAMGDSPRDPHASLEADERRRTIMTALTRLSDKERVAILMREEGFAHREIAEAVGTTTGSVGTLLARALERLARETTFAPDAL